MNSCYGIIKYSGPLTPNYYNQFFHPNICHVCKSYENIKLCEQCHKIAYCCDAHKLLDEQQHKMMCAAITKLPKEESKGTKRYLNSADWYASRKIVLGQIEANMERSLYVNEKCMILQAKSCFICHQQDTLSSCKICSSGYFCAHHRDEFYKRHEPQCRGLLLHLNICISAMNVKEQSLYQLKDKLSTFPDNNKPFRSNLTFLNQYIRNKQYRMLTLEDYCHSECISGPFTLYYGMKEAGLLDLLLPDRFYYQVPEEIACIIHIIVASSQDKSSLPGWELLLHLLNDIKKLIVVMIGKSLEYEVGKQDICNICSCCGREIIFECHPMLYRDYVTSPLYRRPNVIMGFLDSYLLCTLTKNSMKVLQLQWCPILITAPSLTKLRETIEESFGTTIIPLYYEKNKFYSLRPRKSIMNDSVFYRHRCLIIF